MSGDSVETETRNARSRHPSHLPRRPSPDDLPWYAIQTQPRRDEVAEASLGTVCAHVFAPRCRQRVILHGYRRDVTRPLFPGYLFAAFDPYRSFKAVHYAHGVRGVVTFGGELAEVSLDILASIESRMTGGYLVLTPTPLRDGQRVEITAGPFEGFSGVFQAERSGADRVAILLDTLRYNARISVDRAAVRAAV